MEAISKIQASFGGAFGHGWKTMSKYFLILFLVIFVLGILQIPANFVGIGFDADSMKWTEHFNIDYLDSTVIALGVFAVFVGILALAYSILVLPVFKFGARMMFVNAARDIRPEFDTLVVGFKNNYLHIVLANLLVFALVAMGTVFLLIPGIIIACRLAFVPYIVMDKQMDPIAAVEESWKMTKGVHGWTIFGMSLVSFFIFIFGLMLCFVGIFPASIWVKGAFASLYAAIEGEREEEIKLVTE